MMITSDVTPSVMGPAVRLLAAVSRASPRQWLAPDVPALCAALAEAFPGARVGLALSLLLKDAWQFAFRTSNRVPEPHQVRRSPEGILYFYRVDQLVAGCTKYRQNGSLRTI